MNIGYTRVNNYPLPLRVAQDTGTPELLYKVGEYDGLYISPDLYWTSWTRVENILQYLLSGQIDSLEERSRVARAVSYVPRQQRGFVYSTLLKSGFMPATIDAYLPSTDLPKTRDHALRLLQAADYNFSMLSPEEREAIRKLYYLDDDRPVSERMKGGTR